MTDDEKKVMALALEKMEINSGSKLGMDILKRRLGGHGVVPTLPPPRDLHPGGGRLLERIAIGGDVLPHTLQDSDYYKRMAEAEIDKLTTMRGLYTIKDVRTTTTADGIVEINACVVAPMLNQPWRLTFCATPSHEFATKGSMSTLPHGGDATAVRKDDSIVTIPFTLAMQDRYMECLATVTFTDPPSGHTGASAESAIEDGMLSSLKVISQRPVITPGGITKLTIIPINKEITNMDNSQDNTDQKKPLRGRGQVEGLLYHDQFGHPEGNDAQKRVDDLFRFRCDCGSLFGYVNLGLTCSPCQTVCRESVFEETAPVGEEALTRLKITIPVPLKIIDGKVYRKVLITGGRGPEHRIEMGYYTPVNTEDQELSPIRYAVASDGTLELGDAVDGDLTKPLSFFFWTDPLTESEDDVKLRHDRERQLIAAVDEAHAFNSQLSGRTLTLSDKHMTHKLNEENPVASLAENAHTIGISAEPFTPGYFNFKSGLVVDNDGNIVKLGNAKLPEPEAKKKFFVSTKPDGQRRWWREEEIDRVPPEQKTSLRPATEEEATTAQEMLDLDAKHSLVDQDHPELAARIKRLFSALPTATSAATNSALFSAIRRSQK